MKQFGVQMIDNTISSQWWKQIMKHFVRVGDKFEIRCWKEDVAEIREASLYGTAVDDKYEVSIKGIVTTHRHFPCSTIDGNAFEPFVTVVVCFARFYWR